MRASGILLPVTSLPSPYGIGCFSKEAYEFVDQLEKGGEKYWQILPLGPTGYGDSPYQSFSTYAGNPYFIDLETLIEEGLLTKEECDSVDFGSNPAYVDYEKIYMGRFELLEKAFHRFVPDQAYETFVEKNKKWLEDYSLYMAIKNSLGGIAWSEWEAPLKTRQEAALEEKRVELKEQMDFICFQQYEFAKQWEKLKQYANEKDIQIIGDIPIYVAFDSADAWANPELFQFDENSTPLAVAGCPPDAFAATGQLWGNPLYRWDYHAQTGYVWWISRLRHCFTLYDVVRVDHFRGFDEYYAIPYGDKTAENGVWKKGPGIDLFHTVKKELGDVNIIAVAGDGATADCGFQSLSAAAERNEKMLYICYDNEGYMNTGYQRSSTTTKGSRTSTTPIGAKINGKQQQQKYLPLIISMHNVEYCATASPSHMADFVAKIQKGLEASKKGFAYLHVFSPCPTGWVYAPEKAIAVARKAVRSNLFPLWEKDANGYHLNYKNENPISIKEMVKNIGKFKSITEDDIQSIQNIVDYRYELLSRISD